MTVEGAGRKRPLRHARLRATTPRGPDLRAIALLLLKHVRALLVRGPNRGEYDGANCPGAIELLCSQQLRDWHATRVSPAPGQATRIPRTCRPYFVGPD